MAAMYVRTCMRSPRTASFRTNANTFSRHVHAWVGSVMSGGHAERNGWKVVCVTEAKMCVDGADNTALFHHCLV